MRRAPPRYAAIPGQIQPALVLEIPIRLIQFRLYALDQPHLVWLDPE